MPSIKRKRLIGNTAKPALSAAVVAAVSGQVAVAVPVRKKGVVVGYSKVGKAAGRSSRKAEKTGHQKRILEQRNAVYPKNRMRRALAVNLDSISIPRRGKEA